MVANGCFLDEAFGEIKTQNENKGKKKQDQLFLIEVLIVCQKILEDIWKMKNCFLK